VSDWVKVRGYSTRLEAELAQARLQGADIPATIVSHSGGVFGAGFQGYVPGGVMLQVPSSRLRDAEVVLADIPAET